MWIISLLFVPYSKHWKQGQKEYWKRRMEEFNNRSHEGVVANSQDEFDHWSTPRTLMSWIIKKIKVSVLFDQEYWAC